MSRLGGSVTESHLKEMMAQQRMKAEANTAFLAAVTPAHGSTHIVAGPSPCMPFLLVAGGVAMSMA